MTTWLWVVAALVLLFLLPIWVAHRIGRRKGHRHGWAFGIGSWVGVVVAAALLSEREPAAAETGYPYGGTLVERRSRNPIERLGIPEPWRTVLDWIVTIAGAVAVVLALKAWVVNPYRIPSSSMEPTLHCAKPGQGCEARFSDRVLANRFIFHFRSPHRGEIIVFKTPHDAAGNDRAAEACGGEGGTFVKRLIGLPGESVHEDGRGFISIAPPGSKVFHRLDEPYVQAARRLTDDKHYNKTWHVPAGQYLFMGDNRNQSCDSRDWGTVPRRNLIGKVFFIYWPPNRIGFP